MFRRTSSETTTPSPDPKPDGKGRPTPTRKEAEAAARDRARMAFDKKAMTRRQRELRLENSRKIREGQKRGEEQYLPPRDQGPVRRFLRDWVDSRIRFGDIMVPLLFVMVILGFGTFGAAAARFSNAMFLPMLLLGIFQIVALRFQVRREVSQRFPGESLHGLTRYAAMRALNMRFMRHPATRVKVGEQLPDHYR